MCVDERLDRIKTFDAGILPKLVAIVSGGGVVVEKAVYDMLLTIDFFINEESGGT